MMHNSLVRRIARVAPGIGILLVAAAAVADEPAREASPPVVSDDELRTFVDERLDEWWPTAEEKRFDEIGWAADLREARRLSREHGRPVFLFTMDGRVNTGRC